MFITSLLLGYLIGSIPFGLLLTKLAGYGDIRNIGSGNIGATNVLRTGDKKLAAITLLLDGLKGTVAVTVAYLLHSQYYPSCPWVDCVIPDGCPCWDWGGKASIYTLILSGLCAVLGHMFPIWLKFNGGKGVATALGALLAGVPYAGLAACAAWLISAFIFRTSSLSAIIALAVAPLVTYLIYGASPALVCLLISALVIARHHQNIRRLLKGEEPRIGEKKSPSLQGEESARSAQGEGE